MISAIGLAWWALSSAYSRGDAAADLRWNAKWSDQQALQAKALAAATTANRIEEKRRQLAVNEVASDARQQHAAVAADASSADAAGERVRDQAGKLAAGASCTPGDSGIAERGASATRAAMVLSDLFQRADKRAGELARAYDQARIAGLACERSYQALQTHRSTRVTQRSED
ncbi:DUF2514 domain-containing protein [Pseudomonas sp. NPDC088444]|uniref:DUF2514 domain-containing protein n=1 Tax=Pseudomonas sp. NPDC088444 TaxID=3364456 RepID=UPI00384C911F